MLTIELEEMKFYAYHGVLEQEQRVGNTFVVDLKLITNIRYDFAEDLLEETINYAEVYSLVEAIMRVPSQLLETVAYRIAKLLLKTFDKINSLEIKIKKLNPPFHCELKSVTVSLTLGRN